MRTLTVDYNKKPKLFDMEIVEHPATKGKVKIDVSKIERVLTLKLGENYVTGTENLKRLKETGKTLLDARVLEELLAHPELIPDEWKGTWTYFWGTIFRDSGGSLFVVSLRWDGSRWDWHYAWLDFVWNSREPSACLASTSDLGTSDLDTMALRISALESFMEKVENVLKLS